MMIQFPQLQWLHNLKRLLMIAMALLAVLSLGLASFHSLQNAEKVLSWSEYPGQVIAVTLAEEGLVEIEAPIVLVESLPKKIVPEACYPHWEGNTCLILPHNAYAWLEVFDEIDLLITGLLCYQSLWFQYAAERTEGRIVKINTESLPSLIVEYRTAKTSPLRIESDGSEVYREYQVGDTLAVFYDPANPGDARLDLFLEHWLMTMLAGGVTLAVFLLLVLIRRNFASVRSLR